jgi:hypothetical protein
MVEAGESNFRRNEVRSKPSIEVDFIGAFMDILAAVKREERKLEKQLVRQALAPIERGASGCKSSGRFDQPRS